MDLKDIKMSTDVSRIDMMEEIRNRILQMQFAEESAQVSTLSDLLSTAIDEASTMNVVTTTYEATTVTAYVLFFVLECMIKNGILFF